MKFRITSMPKAIYESSHYVGDGCVPPHEPSSAEASKRKDRPGDQPMPVPNDGPSMHDLVCSDLDVYGKNVGALELAELIRERKALGFARYGSILQAFNDRDAVRDAAEEVADLLVYLRQAITEAAEARDEALRSDLAGAYHDAVSAAMVLAWVHARRRPS